MKKKPGKFALSALLIVCIFGASGIVTAATYTNFLGMNLVDIPAGSFEMGSCRMTEGMQKENRKRQFLGLPTIDPGCGKINNEANPNESPRHRVDLPGFRMATTPVTAGQYIRYLKAIGEVDSKDDWGLFNEEFRRLNSYGDNAPVVQVSWHEAQDFIRWMNKNKPQDDPNVYRMPSEAEWEYACRAGKETKYCGSDDVLAVGWVNRAETEHQHDVATKAPNDWGLYDMSGSIWQWVQDVYHENYVGAPTDGSAWIKLILDANKVLEANIQRIEAAVKSGKMKTIEGKLSIQRLRYDANAKHRRGVPIKSETLAARVLRGGSWRFSEAFSRATYRLAGEPGNWYYGNGFRIAATVK